MIHYMNLNPQPFEMIAAGRKTIELRLLDEKRKQIQAGDTKKGKKAGPRQLDADELAAIERLMQEGV